MSKNNRGPFLLISGLLILLFFVFGVRLGARVEKANKTINYVLSLTPKPPSPTPTPKPLKFVSYQNKYCGLKFLYPENFKIEDLSSAGARLKNQNQNVLDLSCQKTQKDLQEMVSDQKISTNEAVFKNKKIKLWENKANAKFYFTLYNTLNGKTIVVIIDKNLYPLFESTLQFTKE